MNQGRSGLKKAYENYAPQVLCYLLYRYSDADLAEELTAATFLRAAEKLPQFQPYKGSFKGWLFQIARNIGHDHFRKQTRRRETPIARVESLPSPNPGPEELAQERDFIEAVLRLMDQLTPEEVDAIALRFGAGMRNQEIAEHLCISDSNVAVRLHRGIRKLREMYDEQDNGN